MFNFVTLIIIISGAINWFCIGVFQFDIIAGIFGTQSHFFSRFVYTVIGLAGFWFLLVTLVKHGQLSLLKPRAKKSKLITSIESENKESNETNDINDNRDTNNEINNSDGINTNSTNSPNELNAYHNKYDKINETKNNVKDDTELEAKQSTNKKKKTEAYDRNKDTT